MFWCNYWPRRYEGYKNPEKYSGYSVIIDTVKYEYTQSGQKVREDELPKKQTMKINGKEYVLE